jgi:hypothetical protein
VGEAVVGAVFPFPYLNMFDRGVSSSAVLMADEAGFEEADEAGFMCRGMHSRGEYLGGYVGEVRGVTFKGCVDECG